MSYFKPAQQNDQEQTLTGAAFTSPNTYQQLLQKVQAKGENKVYININNFIVQVRPSSKFQDGELALNKGQRKAFKVGMIEEIPIKLFSYNENQEQRLTSLKAELTCIFLTPEQQKKGKLEIDDKALEQQFKKNYKDLFFSVGQTQFLLYEGNWFQAQITEQENISLGVKNAQQKSYGLLDEQTDLEFSCKFNQYFNLKQQGLKAKNIFKTDFNFEQLGIGGLDDELANIFRRAFASRRFPPGILKKYGISHVKGLLLYGPPGTGKTLIARKLAKCLNSVEPKIVKGPEIMSSYVGKSEENVRNLFQDAINDTKNLGEESQLHIIIFDEMDAICKSRGREQGAGGSAKDGVVNQILSLLDGVDSLNNILVIGMTNRKDLIDEAILRPGRFEVHVEISLPDESGRQQILNIHTQTMRDNKVLNPNVDLIELAKLTKNFTGAEIEALVKSATSFAFQRIHDIMDFKKQNLEEEVIVELKDFKKALNEVKPSFGVDEEQFEVFLRQPLVNYGPRYERIMSLLENSIKQTQLGKSSQLHSVLLEGELKTGKTSIAAWSAIKSEFPFVKIVSPEKFVGMSEFEKINQISKIFDDAYKSPLSVVVLDNLERLIEFTQIGPRFSNGILQALLVLLKKVPKNKQNKLLIIGTTNQANILQDLEIIQCFNLTINVPQIGGNELVPFTNQYSISSSVQQQISNYVKKISVKQLLMVLDMVQVESEENQTPVSFELFKKIYDSVYQDM